MEVDILPIFQVDSKIVQEHYERNDNYLIEYNHDVPKEYCAVYYSSNDLYYPNNEIAFKESIIRRNRFEWYGNRVCYAHKHIFLRDLHKQWYLTGINKSINSLEKLIEFLKSETEGYRVVVLGASAGGFASIITGQAINAEKIFSFNGQFEIFSLLKKSRPDVDPILFRNSENSKLLPFYDALNFVTSPATIYYFHSNKCKWDIEQAFYARKIGLNKISFRTSNHGIPFLKSNLPTVLNLSDEELLSLSGKTYHPLTFSLKMVGVAQTLRGLSYIIRFGLNKIYIKTFQKLKQQNKTRNS